MGNVSSRLAGGPVHDPDRLAGKLRRLHVAPAGTMIALEDTYSASHDTAVLLAAW
jgi:hypothetical protein